MLYLSFFSSVPSVHTRALRVKPGFPGVADQEARLLGCVMHVPFLRDGLGECGVPFPLLLLYPPGLLAKRQFPFVVGEIFVDFSASHWMLVEQGKCFRHQSVL